MEVIFVRLQHSAWNVVSVASKIALAHIQVIQCNDQPLDISGQRHKEECSGAARREGTSGIAGH